MCWLIHLARAGGAKEQARWYYRLSDTGSDNRVPWNQQQRWYDEGWEGTFERHGINAGVLLLCVMDQLAG
jgi:hypothetical protein